MRISDWSSDVCSSDLDELLAARRDFALPREEVDRFPALEHLWLVGGEPGAHRKIGLRQEDGGTIVDAHRAVLLNWCRVNGCRVNGCRVNGCRSEEHTSELQSLMRISYAVFCLKTKINNY